MQRILILQLYCLLLPLALRLLLCLKLTIMPGPIVMVAELATGLMLALIVTAAYNVHRIAGAVVLLAWSALALANLESIGALTKVIDWRDLHYALDTGFMSSSLPGASFPIIYAVIMLLPLLLLVIRLPQKPVHGSWFIGASLAAAVLATLPATDWRNNSPFVVSGYRAMQPSESASDGPQFPPLRVEPGLSLRDSQVKGAENVIILVLEGISASALTSLQITPGMSRIPQMPALSELANQGLIAANLVSHSNQTIRGLYALLCGDYSKLSLDTYKAAEYQSLAPSQRQPCLPELLRAQGFQTAYMQAAGLEFMGKDSFMPAIGFSEVIGRESIPRAASDRGWGPDDRFFLRHAATEIAERHAHPEPFFITLLTVGTHHPYTLPDELDSSYSELSQDQRALRWLDQAVQEFWQQLVDSGVARDTLLLITSDESRGSPDLPFGNNWGLLVALAPDIAPQINYGHFGLRNLQPSVLDYLGLESQPYGRSVLRHYSEPGRQLAWSNQLLLTANDGGIVTCPAPDQCERWELTGSPQLFATSADYSVSQLNAADSRQRWQQLQRARYDADTTLKIASTSAAFDFARDSTFKLEKGIGSFLIAGKYMQLDKNRNVSLQFRARFQSATSADSQLQLIANLRAIDPVDGKRALLPELQLPPLQPGDLIEVQLSASLATAADVIHPFLFARLNQGQGTLLVEKYSVATRDVTNSDSEELTIWLNGSPIPLEK